MNTTQDNRTALEALTDSSSLLLAASSQCIATLKAENERLREEVAIRAQANRDDAQHKDNYAHDLDKYATLAEAAQSQAAAMAGLLAKARAKMRGAVEPDDVALNDEIDAAILRGRNQTTKTEQGESENVTKEMWQQAAEAALDLLRIRDNFADIERKYLGAKERAEAVLPPLPELPYTMLTPSDCRLLMETYGLACYRAGAALKETPKP